MILLHFKNSENSNKNIMRSYLSMSEQETAEPVPEDLKRSRYAHPLINPNKSPFKDSKFIP